MVVRNFVLAGFVALTLAACSSVSLDSAANRVQVEDRPGGGASGAGDSVVAKTTVTTAAGEGQSSADAMASMSRLVYFDYDSYAIKPEFQALLDANARVLKADSKRKAVIEGHTDERGGREYNLALGQRRAEAVRRALSLLGVADGQIEAISFGKEKPSVAGANEAAWSKNRRAEITYR